MLISKDYIVTYQGTTYQELEDSFAEILAGNEQINSDVCIEGIELYNLTRNEALHVLGYTSDSAKWINGEIRDNNIEDSPSCQSFIYHLDSALKKIPSTNSELLYRVMRGFHEAPKVGDILNIEYYLSTSLEDFNNSEVLWIIKPLPKESRGKDVRKITNNKDELEIIFERNTKFRTTEIQKISNRVCINLSELK